jgi:hypothetical protein
LRIIISGLGWVILINIYVPLTLCDHFVRDSCVCWNEPVVVIWCESSHRVSLPSNPITTYNCHINITPGKKNKIIETHCHMLSSKVNSAHLLKVTFSDKAFTKFILENPIFKNFKLSFGDCYGFQTTYLLIRLLLLPIAKFYLLLNLGTL